MVKLKILVILRIAIAKAKLKLLRNSGLYIAFVCHFYCIALRLVGSVCVRQIGGWRLAFGLRWIMV
jgi:hypothetical protein